MKNPIHCCRGIYYIDIYGLYLLRVVIDDGRVIVVMLEADPLLDVGRLSPML